MAISNVTLLNTSGAGASLAVSSASGVKDFSSAQAQSPASSVVRISARGHALMSLDSLQATAEAIKNSNVPPTLTDFKVLVNGVVSSLNAIRKSAAALATSQSTVNSTVHKRQEVIDNFSSKNKVSAVALRGIGVVRQDNGEFSVNSKQLVKAFNNDGKGAFATLTEFVKKVSGDSAESDSAQSVRGSEKNKGHGKEKNKGVPDSATQYNAQAGSTTNSDVQSGLVVGLVAKSAVTAYSAIASL